jgi:transcription elongation factor GreA
LIPKEYPVTQTNDSVTWLTQEAYDRLSAELQHLSGPGRVEIASKIEAAREEGDLKENGGYHAAKEEQGKIELRIRQLTQLLETAEVGASIEAGVAVAGAVVTIAFDGDDSDTMTFLLGSREDAADGMEVYSPQSPLGTAINGKQVGEQATYDLPNGSPMTVKVLDAQPYRG